MSKYQEILEVLQNAELAARNGKWATCGSECRQAMLIAFRYYEEEQEK